MEGRANTPEMWTAVRIRRALSQGARKHLVVGVGIAVARACGFASGAIVARALGPTRFAAYTVAFTIFSSLQQLTSFADTWMVTRWEDPAARARARVVVWRIKAWGGAGLLSVAGIVSLFLKGWASGIQLDQDLLLLAVSAAIAAGLTTAAATTFQADGRFLGYSAVVAAAPVISAAISALLWRAHVTEVAPYVWVLVLAYIPTVLLSYIRLRVRPAPDGIRSDVATALRFGGWVTIGSVSYVLFQRLDVFLLASIASATEVGMYGAATRLGSVGAFFGSTVTAVLMPLGSSRSTWTEAPKRHDYLVESVIAVGVMSAGLLLVIAAAGPIVTSLFGVAYATAVPYTRVLLLSQIVLIGQMPFYFAMYGLKGERWIAGLGLSQVVTSFVTCFLLTRAYGAIGAAWSNVVTYGLGIAVVGCFLYARRSEMAWT